MASVNTNTKVADFYKKKFPDDELGENIDPKVTFGQVIDCIENDPGTFYSLIGVGDSTVRGRIFTAVAELVHKTYNDVYDRWLDNANPSILEMSTNSGDRIFESIVLSYLLEGKSLMESIVLAEDTITPETIDRIEQTPAFRKLKKDLEFYCDACTDITTYRDGEFKENPIEALEDEADFCQETADFLGSIAFKGFDPEVRAELVKATGDDVDYLDNSAKRLKNLLKKQDNSMYLKPDGSVNPNTNQKPGDYARRALRKLTDFFARLGRDFDFDPDYDKKHPEVFADLDDILRRKGKGELSYESRAWKDGLIKVVNVALDEGITDREVLLNMADDLNLTEEQKEYFRHYVYYILE